MPESKMMKNLRARMTSALGKVGKQLAVKAWKNNEHNDTMNMSDAIGWAVYYNGQLSRNTDRKLEYGWAYPEGDAYEKHRGLGIPLTGPIEYGNMGYGHNYFEYWVTQKYHPKEKGFVLVVIAATFYAAINEKQGTFSVVTYLYNEAVELVNSSSFSLGASGKNRVKFTVLENESGTIGL
jgi:hypothetical protein